jgi:cytochrome c-type biogenesis protein CcsB
MDNLFELSVKFLNYSAFIYLLSALMFFFAVAKAQKSGFALFVAKNSASVAFILHSLGLIMRWYLGGIDRPPWTNLYESLIFFAWGAAMFQILAQYRWKFAHVGVVLVPLVFLLMGMGVMTPNKSVEPLIPALQSNWLKIHVVFGMVAYAAFTVAACISFLHLMRNGFSLSKIGGTLALMSLLNLGLMGGEEIFYTGQFHMARTVERDLGNGQKTRVKDTYRQYEGGPVITRMEKIPHAHIPFFASVFFFLSAAVFMFFKRRKGMKFFSGNDPTVEEAMASGFDLMPIGRSLFSLGMFSMLGLLAWVHYYSSGVESISLQSNPYLIMLLYTTLFFNVFYWVLGFGYKKFLTILPSANRLDELSYKNILFAFPFQTLLLITGAIWAYYAWGRSWGWDPKETWALITWLVYLIYLHGKILLNWKTNYLSLISIIGFIVMVFAFLGVNLVLSGLHSYGSA